MNEELKTYLDKKFAVIVAKSYSAKFTIDEVARLSDEILKLSDSINKLTRDVNRPFSNSAYTRYILQNHEKRIKFLEEHLPNWCTRI